MAREPAAGLPIAGVDGMQESRPGLPMLAGRLMALLRLVRGGAFRGPERGVTRLEGTPIVIGLRSAEVSQTLNALLDEAVQ